MNESEMADRKTDHPVPETEEYFDMTDEQWAAVQEGMADIAAGRVLTEEQFHQSIEDLIARRKAELISLGTSCNVTGLLVDF